WFVTAASFGARAHLHRHPATAQVRLNGDRNPEAREFPIAVRLSRRLRWLPRIIAVCLAAAVLAACGPSDSVGGKGGNGGTPIAAAGGSGDAGASGSAG